MKSQRNPKMGGRGKRTYSKKGQSETSTRGWEKIRCKGIKMRRKTQIARTAETFKDAEANRRSWETFGKGDDKRPARQKVKRGGDSLGRSRKAKKAT